MDGFWDLVGIKDGPLSKNLAVKSTVCEKKEIPTKRIVNLEKHLLKLQNVLHC